MLVYAGASGPVSAQEAIFCREGSLSGLGLEFSKRRGEAIRLELRRVLTARRTPYQQLEIVEAVSCGRALFLDGKIQSAEEDEFIYHEALVQPAMVLHPRPETVLVIGGGEGATLREALRHRTVKRATMVDIDAEAVAACREHLAAWHQGAFADPRVQLLHRDARGYLEETAERYDVIIVDVTDPLAGGPAYRLFTQEFYQIVLAHLSEAGVLAVQAESADLGVLEPHLAVAHTIGSVFPHAAAYNAHVPSFGESWGFVVAPRKRHPLDLTAEEVDRVLAERGVSGLRFYDGESHRRLFLLPKYLRQLLAGGGPIITDAEPVFVA